MCLYLLLKPLRIGDIPSHPSEAGCRVDSNDRDGKWAEEKVKGSGCSWGVAEVWEMLDWGGGGG